MDKTATQASAQTGLSVRTVNDLFIKLRHRLYEIVSRSDDPFGGAIRFYEVQLSNKILINESSQSAWNVDFYRTITEGLYHFKSSRHNFAFDINNDNYFFLKNLINLAGRSLSLRIRTRSLRPSHYIFHFSEVVLKLSYRYHLNYRPILENISQDATDYLFNEEIYEFKAILRSLPSPSFTRNKEGGSMAMFEDIKALLERYPIRATKSYLQPVAQATD